jgi:hypothetical protein
MTVRAIFQMKDAKALVVYWHEKGHGTLKIYQKLSARPGRAYPAYSAILYSTTADWIRRLHKDEDITRRASGSGCSLDEQVTF